MKTKKIQTMVESAVLIALATVLSLLRLVDLPYGGSITIASMLPIILISYRHGLSWGIGSGIIFGAIQQLIGLNTLSWVSTWQSILAVIFLDYVIAYCVCGLGGIFRNRFKSQTVALTLGCILVCVLRYACHVISGATVWRGISIPLATAVISSFIYNATYMIPETIVLLVVACYLGSMINFTTPVPTRIHAVESGASRGLLAAIAGLVGGGAVIFDVTAVFSKIQNAETGAFAPEQFADVNWVLVVAVTAASALIVAALLAIRQTKKH